MDTSSKDKILFWINTWFFHFGIAKSLQEKHNCMLYSIFDVDDKMKKFFQTQKMVNYEKTWYFIDNISNTNKNPDLTYLSNFEKKYNIDLWNLVYTDKYFYPEYNPHHKFSENQILNLLEQECRFFEKILDEIKPDFLCLLVTVSHNETLLYRMCRARGIKVLMTIPSKFRNRMMISENEYSVDSVASIPNNLPKKTDEEIQNFWKSQDLHQHVNAVLKENFDSHALIRYKGILKFFLTRRTESSKKRYSNFGITRMSVLKEKISRSIKRKIRKKFIDANFEKKINDANFVYYPLHYEPERMTLTAGHFYVNQLSVIADIAKSLPPGFKLYVKEHPGQRVHGWRKISYYKQIMEIPNAILIHPQVKQEDIMNKCSLVLTICGSSGLEAAFYKKPSIFLADLGYSMIPSIHLLKSLNELPEAIRSSLKKQVQFSDLNDFVHLIEKNSFVFDFAGMGSDFANRFGLKGPMIDAELSIDKISSFLEDHKHSFEKLANEHISKIKQHKVFQSIPKNN